MSLSKFRYSTFLIAILLIGKPIFGQLPNIDSLLLEVSKAKHDTIIISSYLKISDEFRDINSDSAYKYASLALEMAQQNNLIEQESLALNKLGYIFRIQGKYELAIDYYFKALAIDSSLNDIRSLSFIYNNIGLLNVDKGEYEKALVYYQKSLEKRKQLDDKKGMAGTYSNIGLIHRHLGYYDKAIEQHLNSLKTFEELDDLDGIGRCYNNIGSIHLAQGDYDMALNYYQKSLDIAYQLNDTRGKSRAYNNLGVIYRQKGENEKAIEHYHRSLGVFEVLGDKARIAIAHNNLGNIYIFQKEYSKAKNHLYKSLEIREEIGDKRGVASVSSILCEFYNSYSKGFANNQRKDYLEKGVNYGLRAYEIASELGLQPLQKAASNNLKNAYTEMGRFKEALYFANKNTSLIESLFADEKTKALAEIQTRYETEKKQQEIERQQLVIEQKVIENKRQLAQRNFLIVSSVLLTILALLILRLYQQKNRSHNLITEKNALLRQANEEILATTEALSQQNEELIKKNEKILKQQKEIEEQRNSLANLAWELQEINQEVEKQKSIISAKNIEITDSIIYAQRIQSAVFPSINNLNPFFSNFYILHKPKSIVSGDFYWGTQVKDWLIFCVADCTGHGVPGAFLSMLGIAYLNEIVRKDTVSSSADVLNELREYIINSMVKDNEHEIFYEGMDIGLCVYNTNTKVLQFSGANIPCWIIPSSDLKTIDCDSIIEILPDKMPIGFYERMDHFSKFEYSLEKGDRIYIGTDGYGDQFGGEETKKIQISGLKELICKTYYMPIHEQKVYLHNYFLEWQGEQKQMDDVTLLCIQV